MAPTRRMRFCRQWCRRAAPVRTNDGPDHVNPRLRPPGERDEWRLGVAVDMMEVGARVRSVDRGSPGDTAGLEIGDIIVTVAGFQVGLVDGRTYRLEDELQRQADRTDMRK